MYPCKSLLHFWFLQIIFPLWLLFLNYLFSNEFKTLFCISETIIDIIKTFSSFNFLFFVSGLSSKFNMGKSSFIKYLSILVFPTPSPLLQEALKSINRNSVNDKFFTCNNSPKKKLGSSPSENIRIWTCY